MPSANKIYAKDYKLVKKLGRGAFGEIWKAVHEQNKEEVAIKFEDINARHQQLYYECKIYYFFHTDPSILHQGIPKVVYYGSEKGKNIMIMDLLGNSLEDLFAICERKFSLKTVLMCAQQMIKRIEYVHSRRVIHRDIKPDNFAIGRQNQAHRVYLLDFGLAKKYISSTGKHINYKDGKSLTGTARYSSINTHIGIEQSRRDDLEGLGYVLMYFLLGRLPWQGIKARDTKEKYEMIKQKKVATDLEALGEAFPEPFVKYMIYCRTLGFEDTPDYRYLKKLFSALFTDLGYDFDYKYDWKVKQDKERKGDGFGDEAGQN